MSNASSQKIILGLLCFEGAVISFNIASIAAVVNAIAFDLGGESFRVAGIIPFYMIPYGLAALLYGPLVKRHPVKYIKIACLSLFAIASLVSGLSGSVAVLFLSRVLTGIAAAGTIPVALILIGQLIPRESRGRAVGRFFSVTFISSLLGVLSSGVLPWRQQFILPAVFSVVNLVLVILFFDFKPQAVYDFEVSYLDAIRDKAVFKIFSYIFALSLFYHGIYNWLGVYFSSLGFSQLKVSLLLSLVGFSGIFGQLFGGWATDRKGRAPAACAGLILLSAATALLSRPLSFVFLIVVLFIFGIGWTVNHNAVSTVLTDFPDRLRPELASLNSAVRFASGGLGVVFAGVFMQRSFAFSFLGLATAILCLAAITRKILI